jgi:hypothetical protein
MCNLPKMQIQDLKEILQMKKGQIRFIDFEMPAYELLLDA